ncbi:MAG TPA: hypothetical protein VIK72_04710 [Clostridiaceae bacterium]
MHVLFCNIAWMKNYEGVSEEDKPKNGGAYIKELEYGAECFNFQDYNGKCYGFVMLNGEMNLEEHFKEVKKEDAFLKNVLIIWVATNDTNEAKVIGWYKNATVYREEQGVQAFTNEKFDLYYRTEALSKDCYLIPEEERTFSIQRASQSGEGTGMGRTHVWYAQSTFAQTVLIPKVIEYIDSYKGEYANFVYTDNILNEKLKESYGIDDYKKLYDEGIKCYKDDYFVDSLRFFNTARSIKETPQVISCIAESLLSLNCFNKAIPLFELVIKLQGNKLDAMRNLVSCYDFIGDRKNTIEYCKKLIDILGDAKGNIDEKIYIYCIMFDIYILLRDKKSGREIIDKIAQYSNDDGNQTVDEMVIILKDEFPE